MAAKPPINRLKSYTPGAIVSAPAGERKHILRRFWFPAVILMALAAGGLTGIIAAYQLNYSQAASEVAALATYRPSVVTRIYADDGQTVIGEFALEKRIPLKYEEIPPVMKNAILAVEDVRFYDHIGIDPILDLMAKNGFASQSEVDGAKTKPIQLADSAYYQAPQALSPAFDYPVEYIRGDLEDRYTTRVAQTGLAVYSTINIAAQKKAYDVVRAGLRRYDKSHSGWRSSYEAIPTAANSGVPTPQELACYKYPDWYRNEYVAGRYLMGLVMKVDQARDEATVRFGNYTATVTGADMGCGKRPPHTEFKPGYLAYFEIKEADKKAHRLKVELTQIPGVQGALMTLNAKTGEIVAMIGGYDFLTNKFNNAYQAYRQTGSAFKPFVYSAAIEWGMTPDTTVSGAAIDING